MTSLLAIFRLERGSNLRAAGRGCGHRVRNGGGGHYLNEAARRSDGFGT